MHNDCNLYFILRISIRVDSILKFILYILHFIKKIALRQISHTMHKLCKLSLDYNIANSLHE